MNHDKKPEDTAGSCLLCRRSQRDLLSLSNPPGSAASPSMPPLGRWLPASRASSHVAQQCNLRAHWCINLQAGRKRREKLFLELLHLVPGAALFSDLSSSCVVAVWNSNISHELFSPMPSAELPLPFQSHFRIFDLPCSTLSCPSWTLFMSQASRTVPAS